MSESNKPIIERFTVNQNLPPMPILDIKFDGKRISVKTLVLLANQLASALNDRGCSFEVKK